MTLMEENLNSEESRIPEENGISDEDPVFEEISVTEEIQPSNKKRKKIRLLIIIAAAVIVGAAAVFVFCRFFSYKVFPSLNIADSYTWEIGADLPEAEAFLIHEIDSASLITDLEALDIDTPGTYTVEIQIRNKTYESSLLAVDTTAPSADAVDQEAWLGETFEPEDFVENITDATAVEVSWAEGEPDFEYEGDQDVYILLTDLGGNTATITARLTLVGDHEAPVIEGVEDQTITEGDTISYKNGVTVTDNLDEEVELIIDNSEVDTNTPGTYTVTYSATDSAGNTATITATITVEAKPEETTASSSSSSSSSITEDYVNSLADALLDDILTNGMTQYEQAYTIYWWVHEHISYTGTSTKTSWVIGAYEGLVKRQGDCYTYFATSKVLLTRAGITNMDIYKSTSSGVHYWNLIDIGEGWYHFDATRRADGTTFFYWTDEELWAYSDSHNDSHAYIKENYPEIQ